MIFYFISKSNMYISISSIFTCRTIPHRGCMKILGPFLFHTCFTSLYFQKPQWRSISFFYLLSIWDDVNLQEINLYLCYCCLLTTVCPAVSLRRKTCVLSQSDSVFLMACRVWTKKLKLCFLCSFTSCLFLYSNRFYFINAFWWWRVITASYFEFVCSGLLWYNLSMWLLDWIKKETLTHSRVPVGNWWRVWSHGSIMLKFKYIVL